ncbi:hypothetical protein HNQ77_001276 [Silvibacterium bohemicum]|uniref:Uncharacterized protein n=1 Tax=Silvibacterium bohemicum TaxID=1577686 RepID=A0A841JPM6_9BACT|nr:hypothetical protein [Silvibacterium bohemicum]MBB6143332.1 hypothetical protein [Silvibacterium bohemicum]
MIAEKDVSDRIDSGSGMYPGAEVILISSKRHDWSRALIRAIRDMASLRWHDFLNSKCGRKHKIDDRTGKLQVLRLASLAQDDNFREGV